MSVGSDILTLEHVLIHSKHLNLVEVLVIVGCIAALLAATQHSHIFGVVFRNFVDYTWGAQLVKFALLRKSRLLLHIEYLPVVLSFIVLVEHLVEGVSGRVCQIVLLLEVLCHLPRVVLVCHLDTHYLIS